MMRFGLPRKEDLSRVKKATTFGLTIGAVPQATDNSAQTAIPIVTAVKMKKTAALFRGGVRKRYNDKNQPVFDRPGETLTY